MNKSDNFIPRDYNDMSTEEQLDYHRTHPDESRNEQEYVNPIDVHHSPPERESTHTPNHTHEHHGCACANSISGSSSKSMQEWLRKKVGQEIAVAFLVGTTLLDKSGVLREVGNNFIVLNPTKGVTVMCDLSAVRFITVADTEQG